MSKHTPGRWWANEKRHDDYPTKISIETDSYNICLVDGGLDQQANANLIAAAPVMFSDLIEAAALLREYEKLHRAKGESGYIKAERNKAWAEQFEATIARAKGESQ